MADTDSLSRRIAEACRSLQDETGFEDTIELAARLAVDVIDAAEEAGISLVRRGRVVETSAATGERVLQADRLQHELGDGPVLSGLWDEEVVSCPDLVSDPRWDKWGRRTAEETGIASMLCFRMFSHGQRLGALSVYSSQPHAFSRTDIASGISFAAHIAIAIAVARQDENKDIALDSRSLIGQATGILMERYDLDAVRAFGVLKRISQDSNVKLHEVAAELIRTRVLMRGLPQGPGGKPGA